MNSTPNTEKHVLSAILRNGALFDLAKAKGITVNSFYTGTHRRYFETMEQLNASGQMIDMVALCTALPGAEDAQNIAEIFGTISTDVNFQSWVDQLRQFEAARMIEGAWSKTADYINAAPPDIGGAIAHLTETENAAALIVAGQKQKSLDDIAEDLQDRIKKGSRKTIPFFAHGSEGDFKIHFHPGEFFTIGAGSGKGKTALACGALLEQLRAGHIGAYFCTESTSADILARIVAQHSGISHFETMAARRDENKINHFSTAINEIKTQYQRQLFIFGCESGLVTTDFISSKIKYILNIAGRLDIVYIDFLQQIRPPQSQRRGSALEQINYCITSIHDMLIRENIAGVILSQLNRAGLNSGEDCPNMTWLKDSSLLEQLSHTVAFLHRGKDDKTSFYSDKTRNQPSFAFEIEWNGTGYTSKPHLQQYAPPGNQDCRHGF